MKTKTFLLIWFIFSIRLSFNAMAQIPEVYSFTANGSTIFAGTSKGIFLTNNNGFTWTDANNGLLERFEIQSIATCGTTLIASAGPSLGGMYKSTNNGELWTKIQNGLIKDGWTNRYGNIIVNGTTILLAVDYHGIFALDNNGELWKKSGPKISKKSLDRGNRFRFATDETIIILSTPVDGIYLSADKGKSWKTLNKGLRQYANGNYLDITSIAINGETIYAGINGYYQDNTDGVFKSTDKGESWTRLETFWNNDLTTAIAINGSNVLAGTSTHGVFLSTDNGNTWKEANNGLTSSSINTLAIFGTTIFAGTKDGAFSSTDNGNTWIEINEGLDLISASFKAKNSLTQSNTTTPPLNQKEISKPEIVALSKAGSNAETNNLDISIQMGHVWLWANCVTFSSDGKYVVSASMDQTAILWEVASGRQIQQFVGIPSEIRVVAISADNKLLATGDYRNARVWDMNTGKQLFKLLGDESQIGALHFMGADFLFVGSENSGAALWNAKTGTYIRTFEKRYKVSDFATTNDQKYMYASYSSSITKWEIGTGKNVKEIKEGGGLALSNDNKVMLCRQGNSLFQLDPAKNIIVNRFSFNEDFTAVRLSGDGTKFGILQDINTNLRKLSIRDIYTNQEIASITDPTGERFQDFDISPDGKYVVTCGLDSHVKLWDASTAKEIVEFKGYVNNFGIYTELKLDESGTIIHVGTAPKSGRYWNLKTGKYLPYNSGYSSEVDHLTFSTNSLSGHNRFDKDFPSSSCRSGDGKYIISGLQENDAGKIKVVSSDKNNPFTYTFKGNYRENWEGFRNVVVMESVGNLLVTGSMDNTAKVYDLDQMKEIGTLAGHSNAVWGVAITPDKKRVITMSMDNTTKMWDIETQKVVATFISIGVNDYVITTPDNYYLASKGAYKGVAFRQGLKTFGFEQFDLLLNRPDIVLSRLGYSDPELIESYKLAYLKRLKKMNYTEDMLSRDFHLPEISIVEKDFPLSTKNKQFAFNIVAKDDKYNLDRINLYVNDVPVFSTKGIDLRGKKTSEIQQEIQVELSSGKNKITVSVLNEKGVESLKESIDMLYNEPAEKPDLYLFAIGVSEYQQSEYNLRYAAKDANDLATLLESKKENYKQIIIKKLLDKDATKANILSAGKFLNESKVDDEVILFVAGHGLLDEKLDYYLATTDVVFSHPQTKGLLYEELEGLLDGIASRKKLLLIDACNSGEVDKEENVLTDVSGATTSSGVSSRGFKTIKSKNGLGLQNSFELMQELFSDLRKGTGTVVISSASGKEFAFESDAWKNGVFTYSLLEGLQSTGSDLNKNGEVSVSEIRDYVIKKVDELTQGKQHPTSRSENLENDFRVW